MALPASALLLIVSLGSVRALELVPTDQKKIEKPEGDRVTLDCKFTVGPLDVGSLDIDWALVAADTQQEDQQIIMFSGGMPYVIYDGLKNRVHFNSTDPANGDASIDIINLKSSDTGTYQCKVKKVPGVQSRKIGLSVFLKPAKTRCSIEGSQKIGNDLIFKCGSSEGTAPLTYEWQKLTGSRSLPKGSVLDESTGVLTVKNVSQEHSGTYKCFAKNRVGNDECMVRLDAVPHSNIGGIVAGAIIGTLLSLGLVGLLVYFFCKKKKEKKYEKEVQHEIREDVAPPKSRTSTARSYIGSNHSSLGSLSPSNIDGYSKSLYNKVPNEDQERPPSQTPNFVLPKVAGPNLSRMGAIPVMIPAQNKDGSIV
ncbi:coxsackievirus and adenovirus receptor isoform X1 [Pelobates cultripes]|uniref:Coxsackievirus and adenovirus receptor isoform X1 n=1 Tax=Pelobates cultripes TaxID=61616 RepID=A0AAD1QY60_PELCU|nr:coxsackievirus and adenovirus receptor isoform X1 [Pelobates cultripes]